MQFVGAIDDLDARVSGGNHISAVVAIVLSDDTAVGEFIDNTGAGRG